MAFCNKCGAVIAFAGGKCPRCGTMGEGGTATAGKVVVEDTGFSKDILLGKLERYKQLLGECEELSTMIKPQNDYPVSLDTNFRKRSFMKFFWPFMVIGIVAGYLVYMASSFFLALSTADMVVDSQAAASRVLGDAFGGIIVALIVAGAIIFFGIKVAKRKQEDFNSNADYMNRAAQERYNKGLENQKMINLFQENVTEMHKYEYLVPEEHRTFAHVSSIINFIKEDRAKTVEEACALI